MSKQIIVRTLDEYKQTKEEKELKEQMDCLLEVAFGGKYWWTNFSDEEQAQKHETQAPTSEPNELSILQAKREELSAALDLALTPILNKLASQITGTKAEALLDSLRQAKQAYLERIRDNQVNIHQAHEQFQEHCSQLINTVKPELEKELDCGDLFINFLKAVANALIYVMNKLSNSSNPNNFFSPNRNQSAQAIEHAENDLSAIEKPRLQ